MRPFKPLTGILAFCGAVLLILSPILFPLEGLAAEPEVAPASKISLPGMKNVSQASGNDSFLEKWERLREDRRLQDLVEEDLEKSIVIRAQIQEEVDRAFSHTTSLLNVLLGVLTFLPVLAAVSIWFIRRSVINQIIGETKQQLREEVEKQFEQEIAAELKQQAEAFKQEIDKLRTEFANQLAQLKSVIVDAQKVKDRIIQELSQITPSPIRDSASPETQQKIQELTRQLELLRSTGSQLSFSANDYVEQGKAFYFEGRFEDALSCYEQSIQIEPENARAWFGKGAALTKLQQLEGAIVAYEKAIDIKPDFSEAWFGKGTALAKLQKVEGAIAAYDKATEIKPDFFLAWFSKARCHAAQGDLELVLKSLQNAIQLNSEKAREAIKTDTLFDGMRDSEQFKQLVAEYSKGLSAED